MPEHDPLDPAVDLPCPSCGRRLRASLGVVRGGGAVRCPVDHVVDLRVGRDGLPQVDRFVGDLLRAIARHEAPTHGPARRHRGDRPPR